MDFIWEEKGNGIVNADILAQTFSGIVVNYGWKARKTDGRTVRVRILETDIPYPSPYPASQPSFMNHLYPASQPQASNHL